MKVSISKNGIACGLLRENLEKIAEADIRSAYGEDIQRPKIGMISDELYAETIRWIESPEDLNKL